MSNMDIWDSVCRPPATALKEIKGGRLKGFTDVNPQWRIKAMTEQFGPCGIGWKYEIVRLWTETIESGEILAFATVNLYIPGGDVKWSYPIPGIGGSMLVARESSGLRSSDEAYKMATTDALSVAMKTIGVAADIYAGMWDGSKYKDDKKTDRQPIDNTKPITAEFQQVNPDPVDHEKVEIAYVRAIEIVDSDDMDAGPDVARELLKSLSNDERIALKDRLQEMKGGATGRKSYYTMFKEYLDYKPMEA